MRTNEIAANRKYLNIIVIAGVRPQFIKVASLQKAISEYNLNYTDIKFNAKYLNAGQHYSSELSNLIIKELNVHFDYTVFHSDKDPTHMFAKMIFDMYEYLKKLTLDWVIIIGDTSTSLAGAIVAKRLGIPVVHIEAGIRSGDLRSIEEVHRRMVSHISSAHFCASISGVQNLKNEGITQNVFWTGDLIYDYFLQYSSGLQAGIDECSNNEYILVTIHKPTNLNSKDILSNLINVLDKYPRKVLFVMHPRCKQVIAQSGLLRENSNITFTDALPYSKMVSAIKGCTFVITDSGGLQREAYYLKKRCLVRRDSLGWGEFISAGINHLINGDKSGISKGLEWMEANLSTNFPVLNGFTRPNSASYMLSCLMDLKPYPDQ